MEFLTNNEREILPQIVDKAVKLTSEQQNFVLGWMMAKIDENEERQHVNGRRRKNNN